ncbi:MAG TPA: lytic transglycosylase domain-containing protein [Stellaceae bacterium]|nr:lytic transglycosylase domain-containing protein [Stellaceae bacterium]
MFPVFRHVFVALIAVAILVPSSFAQEPTDQKQTAAIAAIAAAQAGDWVKAYAQASESKNPLTVKIVHWLDDTRGSTAGHFSEISGFIQQNPDWPLQKTLRRRAEEALVTESDDTAAAWLKRYPPQSAIGKMREAELMIKRGNVDAGTAALRAAWIDGDFLVADEHSLASRFSSTFRSEDHEKRLDRLLWDGQTDAARRMLPMVAADHRVVVEARMALAANASNAESLLAKVPAGLRSDPGLDFDHARWLRKKDQLDAAAQRLLAHPDNPVRPAIWWSERQMVARKLLAAGNSDIAFKLVQQQGPEDPGSYAEAEFLSGYIALRFQKNPTLAFEHFAQILARADSPFGKARAAYWGGRAAQAAGNTELANKWYTAGADHMATFYGQLAAHQLGKDAPPKPVPEPRADPGQLGRFNAHELVRAARLFFAAGDRDHARTCLLQVAEHAKTALDFAMLASVAESAGRIDVAIAVARRAIDAGMPLMVHGYPVTALPTGGATERPLVFAIVRQESAFATDAKSGVGARGLMQLMPGTAELVAKKLQMPYSADRLSSDGLYNLTLGESYLEKLIEDFGGSYPLAIAAYNAGPGRVRQWLREFGDPRGRDLDMVDWVEMIPFNETRTYVQRVLENLQIYRGQDRDNGSAFSLASDLAR